MRYEIRGVVANGNYESPDMGAGYSRCELASIRFFDANGTQVTPSAGSVTFSTSADGVNYRPAVEGTFDAADAYYSVRAVPAAGGLVTKARVNLAGVTGAVRFVALVWRI
jgi:hypothetical protein